MAIGTKVNILCGVVDFYTADPGVALPELDNNDSGVLQFSTSETNEVQSMAFTATGGTFTLIYQDKGGVDHETGAITVSGMAIGDVQTALNALPPLVSDGVVVTGSGTPYTITFSGALTAGVDQNLIRPNNESATGGTVVVTQTTPGVGIWTEAGYTEEGVDFEYTPTYEMKHVDQMNGPIKTILTEEEAKFAFNLAQRGLLDFERAMAAVQMQNKDAAANQSAQTIMGIGDASVKEVQLAMVGVSPQGYYRLWYAPLAVATTSLTNKEDKQANNIPVEFSIEADPTQNEGLRMVQVYDMTAVPTS